MKFERRDFFRLGAAGLAGSAFSWESAFGQDKDRDQDAKSGAIAELRGGSGTLYLELKLRSGTLKLQVEEFRSGKDHAAVARGTFARAGGARIKLYRSFFCVDDARQVFARLGDDDHWTSLLLARTDDANVESLTVWNDAKPSESFRIDKKKFLAVANTKGGPNPQDYIIDGKNGNPDLKGSRMPPDVTVEDLENALDNNRDYLAFRRGDRPPRQHASLAAFECGFLVVGVIGGVFFWIPWDAGR